MWSAKVLTKHLKVEQARRLAERRPTLFSGLEGWNHKQHNRLLLAVSPYERMVLVKLWTGAAMCQHKRSQVYGESASCVCGCDDQTLRHLLWECPCVPPPPVSIEYRRHLPNSQAVSHILPPMASRVDVDLWKQSCMRAVRILAKNPNARLTHREPVDTSGHDVAVNASGSYAFCMKCFVTRRIRDKKWIWARECKHEQRESRAIGETWTYEGHEITLTMERWKIMAERPSMHCCICEHRVWATRGFREPCPGGA